MGIIKNLPMFISFLRQMVQLIFLHTYDVACFLQSILSLHESSLVYQLWEYFIYENKDL